MDEVWKDVVGYEGIYLVSSHGRVYRRPRIVTDSIGRKRLFRGGILKENLGRHGYLYVSLSKDGKERSEFIHRMVAKAFLPNEDAAVKTEVNHIDEDKTNNRVFNLEWVSRIENRRYGTGTERMLESRNENGSYGKEMRVGKFSLDGDLIESYKSASEAARENGAIVTNICACCRGERGRKTHKGFVWKYL